MGPGFDVLGAALGLYNELELTRLPGRKFEFTVEGEGHRELSRGNFVAQRLKKFGGWRLRMVNRIPLARGLGSSGSAHLATEAAVCALEGRALPQALDAAAQIEGHADNAAASFLGGLVSSRFDGRHVEAKKWGIPKAWKAVVAVPEFKLSTELARRALPKKVPLADAVENLGRVAALLSAVAEADGDALGEAMDDSLHQPYRKKLIPGFEKVVQAARSAGALGACLSGAGSSILAVVDSDPEKVGRAMEIAFDSAGVRARAQTLSFDRGGLLLQWS
jgi:homoserine kinase